MKVRARCRSEEASRAATPCSGFDDGAARVVVGTRALEEPEWLAGTASAFPQRLVVAADVRDRRVLTRGWQRTLSRNVLDVIEELNALPLAAIVVTAVHRDGHLAGTDLFLMEDAADASSHPTHCVGRCDDDERSPRPRGPRGQLQPWWAWPSTRVRSTRAPSPRSSPNDIGAAVEGPTVTAGGIKRLLDRDGSPRRQAG